VFHKIVIHNTGLENKSQSTDNANRQVLYHTAALDEAVRHGLFFGTHILTGRRQQF
jgi:hypothetical protein